MYLLHHLLENTAKRYPERTAVVFDDRCLSYAELNEKSNRLAAVLAASGVEPGSRVGILLEKSFESLISVFGILKAGAVYVPLDATAPAVRLTAIINNCGIEVILATSGNLAELLADPGDKPALRTAIVPGPFPDEPPAGLACVSWDDALAGTIPFHPKDQSNATPAYILHTSGSTGIPKGVVISHLNALTFVDMAVEFFGLDEKDRMANHAPLHFDLSVFDIFCAVKAGAAIVIVPEYLSAFPVSLADFIDQQEITVWNSVASVLTKLADRGGLDRLTLESLRLVHFSGDLMPVKYLRVLRKRMPKAEFYNIYGQTEANSSLYFKVPDMVPGDIWKIPIGRPFPNFEVFALDAGGKVIRSTDEEGELHVLSATVALGYWNDPARTGQQFMHDPRNQGAQTRVYRTGDLVRLDGEGNFIFTGRQDHMVKTKGYRVELDEIELILSSDPRIRQVAVVAIPDELVGNKIVAYIALQESTEVDTKQFQRLCGEHLPQYMVPETIKLCETLPSTSNDKVNRKALVQDYLAERNQPAQDRG